MVQTADFATARDAAEALGDRLCELAALIHSATADLIRTATAFDDAAGWQGDGIRSCAHWLSINAGLGLHTADELLRIGHALAVLPAVAAAFAAGQLSLDKVRAVTRVATAADEQIWLELARQASGAQLARICREYRRATRVDLPEHAAVELARRGVWSSWEDDGMLTLRALLPAEDGALVLAALERVAGPHPAHSRMR